MEAMISSLNHPNRVGFIFTQTLQIIHSRFTFRVYSEHVSKSHIFYWRNSRMKETMFVSAVLLGVMFILAACGGGNASDPTEGEEKSDKASGETGGSIIGDGSSTVFPIMEIINEEFNAEHGMAAEIGVSGTGAGFERFT